MAVHIQKINVRRKGETLFFILYHKNSPVHIDSNKREKESSAAYFIQPLVSDVCLLDAFREGQIKFHIRASPCSPFLSFY